MLVNSIVLIEAKHPAPYIIIHDPSVLFRMVSSREVGSLSLILILLVEDYYYLVYLGHTIYVYYVMSVHSLSLLPKVDVFNYSHAVSLNCRPSVL